MPTEGELVPIIRTARLELVSMTLPFMEALLEGDAAAAGSAIGAEVSETLRDHLEDFLRYRLAQVRADPAIRRWLGRGIVLTTDEGTRHVIGTIGFHGPPDAQGRLEIGYSVQGAYRRHGFAREAVRAMLDWAYRDHGIRKFVASISPTNEPSLNLVRGFGFAQTGEQMDEVDGLELVFEATWPPADSTGDAAARP